MPLGGKSLEQPVRRLFFALWPDEGVRTHLQQTVVQLRSRVSAHWVPRENFHITLAFLGPVAESGCQQLRRIDPVWPEAFVIRLDDLRLLRRQQMVWIAARAEPPPLRRLVDVLGVELESLGVTPCGVRAFHPHLTLARRVTGPWPNPLAFDPIEWTIRSVNLVQSVLDHSGAHYQRLNAWPLRAMPMGASVE